MLDKHDNANDFYFSIGENHSFMKMNNDVHHYSRGNNFFGQNGLKQRGIIFLLRGIQMKYLCNQYLLVIVFFRLNQNRMDWISNSTL
jgi:hypothetical protein